MGLYDTPMEKALLKQQYEVESLLAEALGYVYEADHGWLIGDHTIVTLAMQVRQRGVLPTREEVAHRYHRYHCHGSNPHTCDVLDEDDYDYADALADILAVGKHGSL